MHILVCDYVGVRDRERLVVGGEGKIVILRVKTMDDKLIISPM